MKLSLHKKMKFSIKGLIKMKNFIFCEVQLETQFWSKAEDHRLL